MKLLHAAAALVLAANAVVLAGVVYNRSGEPEAALRLTERELALANYAWWGGEKSGIGLTLRWRLPVRGADRSDYFTYGWGGEATWLDEAKLRELGFEPPPPGAAPERRSRRERERVVYLVLELDGAAYQSVLKVARDAVAKEQAAGGKAKGAYNSAVDWLAREERSSSRLFAIDAGRDAQALRAKYPERNRHAIVEGRVRPYYNQGPGGDKVTAHIRALSISSINVPLESRALFASLSATPYDAQGNTGPRYDALVAWGKRFEPRLVDAKRLAD